MFSFCCSIALKSTAAAAPLPSFEILPCEASCNGDTERDVLRCDVLREAAMPAAVMLRPKASGLLASHKQHGLRTEATTFQSRDIGIFASGSFITPVRNIGFDTSSQ